MCINSVLRKVLRKEVFFCWVVFLCITSVTEVRAARKTKKNKQTTTSKGKPESKTSQDQPKVPEEPKKATVAKMEEVPPADSSQAQSASNDPNMTPGESKEDPNKSDTEKQSEEEEDDEDDDEEEKDKDKKKGPLVGEVRAIRKTWVFSAVLPGLGQAYSGYYWKVPIIYAGFGGIVWGAYKFRKKYKDAQKRLKKDRSNTALEKKAVDYRKWRNFCYILFGFWWTMNAVEAYAGAHLKNFDVSDTFKQPEKKKKKSTVKIKPYTKGKEAGISLSLEAK